MKILAIEDEALTANALEVLVRQLGYDWLGVTDNSETFLQLWRATQPDLVLIDIHVKGKLDGIQVAEVIGQSEQPIPLIFITSFQDQETFERAKTLNPFAFIIKPFDTTTLQRTIELAVYQYIHQTWEVPENLPWQKDLVSKKSFFIKTGQRLKKIEIKNIDFIQADNKHCQLISQSQSYIVRLTLSELASKLPANQFIRVHRSYIVQVDKIEEVNLKTNTLLIAAQEIPFSAAYKKELFNRLELLN